VENKNTDGHQMMAIFVFTKPLNNTKNVFFRKSQVEKTQNMLTE